jgi:hypothetical protein
MGSGINVVLVGAIATWGHVSERRARSSEETIYQSKSLDPCLGQRQLFRKSNSETGVGILPCYQASMNNHFFKDIQKAFVEVGFCSIRIAKMCSKHWSRYFLGSLLVCRKRHGKKARTPGFEPYTLYISK